VAVHNQLSVRFGHSIPADVLREVGNRVLSAGGGRLLGPPDGITRLEILAFEVAADMLRACKISPTRDAVQ
jgi:hypothetical protein